MASEVTVGIDIGTTSVKAVAVDGDGRVLARARVPHPLKAGHAGELAHDAGLAWRDGVLEALAEVTADLDVRAVSVAAMVPSLCAVDADGRPLSDGLLYGDARGAGGGREPRTRPSPASWSASWRGWSKRIPTPRATGRPRPWPTTRCAATGRSTRSWP